jgi:hypothetical protein
VVVETTTEEGQKVRMDAFTQVVNAHGGLLELSLRVNKGQEMLLTNPAMDVQESCRVVGLRTSEDAYYAVAFEFENPCPQFWPISFPPADWALVQTEK